MCLSGQYRHSEVGFSSTIFSLWSFFYRGISTSANLSLPLICCTLLRQSGNQIRFRFVFVCPIVPSFDLRCCLRATVTINYLDALVVKPFSYSDFAINIYAVWDMTAQPNLRQVFFGGQWAFFWAQSMKAKSTPKKILRFLLPGRKFYLCIEKNLTWYLTILLSQNFQNPTLPVFLGLYWRNPLHFVLTGVISSPMECSSGFEENAVVSDMTHNWLYLIQLISSSLQSILLQNVIDLQNSQSF